MGSGAAFVFKQTAVIVLATVAELAFINRGSRLGEFPALPVLTKVTEQDGQTADLIFFIKSTSCFNFAVLWRRCKSQLLNEFVPRVACCDMMCV